MERTTTLSPRMLQALAIRERCSDERGGKGATLKQIGEEMGICGQRVRQLILGAERRLRLQEERRDNEQHDAHVARWRQVWIVTLDALRRAAAHEQNRKRRAVQVHGSRPRPKLKPPRRASYTIYKPLSQEKLKQLARRTHWSNVVYHNGTDHIVSVSRGW